MRSLALLPLASAAILLAACADLTGPADVHIPGPDDGTNFPEGLPEMELVLTIAGAGEYQLQVGDSVTLRAEVLQRYCGGCEFQPISVAISWEVDGSAVVEAIRPSDDSVIVRVTGEGTAVVRATYAGLWAEVRITGRP
jgi:hypothetical protein